MATAGVTCKLRPFSTHRPPMSSAEVDALISALKTHIDAKRFSIAICTWVFHEIFITTGDSMDLFWMQKRWSASKILFFINRITAVLIAVAIAVLNFASFESDYDCTVATWAEFVISIFIISIVAFTLASRVYALWKGNYIVLTIFFFVMSANIANYVFMYGVALSRGTPIVSQPPFTGCAFIPKSDVLWIIFANTLIFEAISIGLIVYRAWPIARQREVTTPLFSLLLEDGIGYYLAFTASKLFTVGAIYSPTVISLVVLPSYLSVPVAALAINRLFIRLQRVMVTKRLTTELTGASFSAVKSDSRSSTGGSSGPRDIITIGGTGRTHARRHQQNEIYSDGSVELCTAGELYMATTRHDSIPNSVSTAGRIDNGLRSKQGNV